MRKIHIMAAVCLSFLYCTAQAQVKVLSNGNVGIGTLNPQNKLSVNTRASFGIDGTNIGLEPLEVGGNGAGISIHDRIGGVNERWVLYSARSISNSVNTQTLRIWNNGDRFRFFLMVI